jgi:hypothetical protein
MKSIKLPHYRAFWLGSACLCLALLCQTACRKIEQKSSAIEIDLYFDFSIEWPDDETRRQLIKKLIEAFRQHPLIGKVRVIELGTARKASASFSRDFDLGEALNCPAPEIAPGLRGNVKATQQAEEKARRQCKNLKAEREQRIEQALADLQAWLLRQPDNLTSCTSFAEFVLRLQQDAPGFAFIVTDGRANCAEAPAVYQAAAHQRLVVLQCPAPDGRMAERQLALQAMLPTARVFSLPQMALAMQGLAETTASIAQKNK